MSRIYPLAADTEESADIIGSKARGLVEMLRLGLPVPPGFVIGTDACRAFLRDRRLPHGLDGELATAVADLEVAAGRPLVVSVRSGGRDPMPGMMSTILNLDLTPQATAAMHELKRAVRAVFSSWEAPRAVTYRELHGIPHALGTAGTVQAMVFGDRDDHSGAGVAFSRDPNTGVPVPFGEVLFGHQGDDVVSGRSVTRPLPELAEREPAVWADLGDALHRIEQHYRDACSVEFTFEAGELWLLQVRPGGLSGRAAVRVAVDLADDGVISRREAVQRVSPRRLDDAHTPRIDPAGPIDLLARGTGASPGVAAGRVATTAETAVRMAAEGPVILVRPETSPLDMPGLAAADGVVTARGGPASHAAVVARALGKPAVVGASDLRRKPELLPEGTVLTIDGTSGEVVAGHPRIVTAPTDPHLTRLLTWTDEI